MKKLVYTLGIVTIIATACNSETESTTNNTTTESPETVIDSRLALLSKNCFTCHNPEKNAPTRIAPAMADIRVAYLTANEEKDVFVDNFLRFVNTPSEQNSFMPESIKQFGIMPKLSYSQDDLKAIAAYVYENSMTGDEWIKQQESLNNISTSTIDTNISYTELGMNIANGTKAQLGKNLMTAIKEHGAAGAVSFCNTRAIPLTDSMAKVYSAYVKRVSDKPRNPDNKASEIEIEYIKQMKAQLAAGEEPKAIITESNNMVIGYYAIVTNKMCLQCHGSKNKDILPETLANIRKSYPNDAATEYGENELRGIWVVEMDKR